MEAIGEIAIILAPDDKGLVTVFGIPAARRLILLALQLGLKEIHIIGRVKSLRPVLSDLVPLERFHPVDNPASLGQVVERLALPDQQRVLAMKANYIVDQGSLTQLIEAGNHSGLYFMEAKENKAEGLYLTAPSSLVSIIQHLWSSSPHFPIPDEAHPVVGMDGLPYVLERGEAQAKIAEDRLMKAQAAKTRKNDGFLARHLSRPISRFISGRLAHTPATPNQITMGGVIIGMTGAVFFSQPGYWHHLVGSLLFLLCIIVDGVDGEVARLKLQETPLGHRLDIITDNFVHLAVFAGIALGLYHDSGDPVYFWILGVLVGGFGLCGIAVYQCISRRSTEELRWSGSAVRIMDMLNNRDFAYILVALALVQRLQWFLIGAAIGTYLFALALWMARYYEKRVAADWACHLTVLSGLIRKIFLRAGDFLKSYFSGRKFTRYG
jgi:phosphatidylglycerophosphate synthase